MRASDLCVLSAVILTLGAMSREAVAQHSMDSVRIAGVASTPTHLVILRGAGLSFDVTTAEDSDVIASLSAAVRRSSALSQAGLLRATRSGDTVRIELSRPLVHPATLLATVPRGVELQLTGDNGGAVRVGRAAGPVEVTTSNGAVSVAGASGHVLIATSNGGIDVVLDAVTAGVPISLVTSNDDVSLSLPSDVRLTLLIEDAIPLESDFSLVREPPAANARAAPSGPLRLQLNGGGATLRLYTNNGTVRLHRLPARAP